MTHHDLSPGPEPRKILACARAHRAPDKALFAGKGGHVADLGIGSIWVMALQLRRLIKEMCPVLM
jgi:hypothetical protein